MHKWSIITTQRILSVCVRTKPIQRGSPPERYYGGANQAIVFNHSTFLLLGAKQFGFNTLAAVRERMRGKRCDLFVVKAFETLAQFNNIFAVGNRVGKTLVVIMQSIVIAVLT